MEKTEKAIQDLEKVIEALISYNYSKTKIINTILVQKKEQVLYHLQSAIKLLKDHK